MKAFCFFEKEIEQAKTQHEAFKQARTSDLFTTPQCEKCGLYKKVKTPCMQYSGNGREKILVVGEAPGRMEDMIGTQFVGDSGEKLRAHFEAHGIDLVQDCWKINAVNCRPTSPDGMANRTPTPNELAYCRPMLMDTIADVKPRSILLFGANAVNSFLADRTATIQRSSAIEDWRGLHFPDLNSGAEVYPLLHPAYLMRNPQAEHVFARDLKNALDMHNQYKTSDRLVCGMPLSTNWNRYVKTLTDFPSIVSFLNRVISGEFLFISVDYETTGLKPFRPGHKIVSVSIGYMLNNSPRAVSFPISHPGCDLSDKEREQIIGLLKKVLTSDVGKVAQNIQMEEKWSRKIIGCEVRPWMWDTMQTSHIIDERDKFTSLDKQVFLMAGYEYGSNISYYKQGFPFNRMMEVPILELLQYGGLDALFTIMLFHYQRECLFTEFRLKQANNFWLESTKSFCDLEYSGIRIDPDYYETTIRSISNEMDRLTQQIDSTPEVLEFNRVYNRMPDLGSKGGVTTDMSELFFKVMKLEPLRHTDYGKPALDDDFLSKQDLSLCKMISRLRKLNKTKSTYLSGYLTEVIDDTIYPNSNLHLVRTYRSSMSNPNAQNIPNRDEEAKKLVRSGIIPPDGYRIATVDYGSHEVRIIASYFKDPVLINEVKTGHDFHGDFAKALKLDEQRPWKEARYDSKNAFVFPMFYGSWYESIARDLRSRGYEITDSQVQSVEKMFWNKYAVTKENQQKLIDFYQTHGYIELCWGHRRRGIISRNQIANSCVQGTAFHCLLWSLNRINKLRRLEGWKSYIPAQIHDELFCYVHESETKYFVETVTRIMQEEIVAENDFILVPLLAEWSFCDLGQPWYTKKSVKPENLSTFLEDL